MVDRRFCYECFHSSNTIDGYCSSCYKRIQREEKQLEEKKDNVVE